MLHLDRHTQAHGQLSDKAWEDIKKAAENANELVWRMPLDKAFAKNIKSSKVADLKNTDFSGNAGSCSAKQCF
nr:hypothetical protein [Mycoplasmopsis bovis]